MRAVSLPIFLALVALACPAATDSTAGKDAPADAKPADSTKPPADAKPPADIETPDSAVADKRAKAKAKFTETDDAELGRRRTQMLASLNEGRKLVKAGDVEGGIAKYEELLAIAPHYGPALGELGWAEFKAVEYDEAHAHTQRALAETTDPNKRGMLLYNLGRIAEARGQNDAAIGHYQASLAVRPNETVAARLAGLPAPIVAPAPSTPTDAPVPPGLVLLGKDLADLEAMCEVAGRESLCSDGNCEIVATPERETGVGLLHTTDGMVGCWHPVVNTASGWMMFDLTMVSQCGSEVDQDVDKLESRIEKNDAGEFLIIEFSDHVYERGWFDLEDEEAEFPDLAATDREAVIVCRRDGVPACTPPIVTREKNHEEDGDSSYSASLSLRGDVIVIADVATSGDVSLGLGGGWDESEFTTLSAGEYPFADLAKASR